jgi:AAA domain
LSKHEADNKSKMPSLDASGIAEYIRFDCCPRFFKLKFEGDEESDRKWPEAFKPLSPLLYGSGRDLEKAKVEELKKKAADFIDLHESAMGEKDWEEPWNKALQQIKEIIKNKISNINVDQKLIIFYQVPMVGQIGLWKIKGRSDLIVVWPRKDGKVKVRIFEIKASWKEQTAHRIQVAIYTLMLSQGLGELSDSVELEGGVINKESDLENLASEKLRFKLEPLIQDVKRLLSKNGELYRIHQKSLQDVEYQLCWRCDNCGFNECCIVRAVEKESIALLNLSRGEQNALGSQGIHQLEDLAKLKPVLEINDQRPYNFKEVPFKDKGKVHALSTDQVVGAKLDKLIQRAQFMLSGIRPTSASATKTRWMPWLSGSGYGSLPEETAQEGVNASLSIKPDCMIRIYFHIQWDYLLDIVSMASASVNCTSYRGEAISVSQIVSDLPDEKEECLNEEKAMLEVFFASLVKAIKQVATEVGSPNQAIIHLYFYTQRERDVLMEAVRRQPTLISARAVRDLLGLRQAIDQPMFSIVQNEVLLRKALGYHSTGLLPVLEKIGYFDLNQWLAKRKDGTRVDLRAAFRDGFFNYSLPFRRNPDGSISFVLTHEDNKRNDGYYPARARFGNQIPLEYFWAAKGRLSNTQSKGFTNFFIEKRMWCDWPHKTRRITEEELTLLGAKLCLALEFIERSITIRNRRLGKKPIAIPKIEEFTLGPATLERSCREFLDLEYFSKRQDLYQYYALLPYQRVASGRSVLFECTSTRETEREFEVKGKLIYDCLGLPNADCVVNACRLKGSDGSSSGDWMVVTEVKRSEQGLFEETHDRSPSEVEKSARVIVDKIDSRKMELTVKVISWPSGKSRKYSAWHNLPTTDPEKAKSKYMQLFEVGRTYILDELADDIISERAAECLDYAGNNALYSLLDGYLTGKSKPSERKCLSNKSADKFLSWLKSRRFAPKNEQMSFINRVFSKEQIVLLQGPPGTGKTESLQLAVLAHVAAHKSSSRCRVLMVAPTHKAIQEFVDKLAASWQSYCKEVDGDMANLRIYRVTSSNIGSGKSADGVIYVDYNNDEKTLGELKDCLLNQEKLGASGSSAWPLILCVTPPGMYGLMKKIGDGSPPWGQGFFDLLAVDEASMMRLPELILSGAFVSKNAQILVAGDHRQLPPIQAHDWEKEDRRTIEEMASFLSAQDFLRLLRQEDLGMDHICCQHQADIPAERLSETHRCHEVVAAFLKEWVYSKDGIDFRSDQTKTLKPVHCLTRALDVALDPENVFVLIVHDEAESFQSNMLEARIVDALVRSVNSDDVGIVTPHNAQRGLVNKMLSDRNRKVRVDTVERYQGGEADFIIISSTVSDPDYVRSESDFLLNVNRINVAISRMRKKIVIVASRSIFEFMPQDAKDYEKAVLWRGIAQTVGFKVDSAPEWKGTLTDFLGQEASTVNIEIYAKKPEKASLDEK